MVGFVDLQREKIGVSENTFLVKREFYLSRLL
jgi:hypothetical protein